VFPRDFSSKKRLEERNAAKYFKNIDNLLEAKEPYDPGPSNARRMNGLPPYRPGVPVPQLPYDILFYQLLLPYYYCYGGSSGNWEKENQQLQKTPWIAHKHTFVYEYIRLRQIGKDWNRAITNHGYFIFAISHFWRMKAHDNFYTDSLIWRWYPDADRYFISGFSWIAIAYAAHSDQDFFELKMINGYSYSAAAKKEYIKSIEKKYEIEQKSSKEGYDTYRFLFGSPNNNSHPNAAKFCLPSKQSKEQNSHRSKKKKARV
jgi:hypothetical protein